MSEHPPLTAAIPYAPPGDDGRPPLFADACLLVVDKPAGLLSVPGRGDAHQDCLIARLHARGYDDARIVHRLDMATSGLLVVARGDAAQRELSRQFREREVDKRYVAVVAGLMPDDAGSIDLPLICDWPNRPRQMVDFTIGKPSLTHYRVLARDPASDSTRVELEPVTGRSHQLRVHLAALGHPILGDELYAGAAAARAPRLLLHASKIRFFHPSTVESLEFSSPPPF